MELVCNAAIDDGDGEDSDGISLPRNTLATSDRMIVGPLGQIANLDYSRLADDSNHKVDGVKPTVSSAEAMEDSLTIKFSEALDEDSTPATSAFIAPRFTLGLEATRREPSANDPPEHRLMLRGALRW